MNIFSQDFASGSTIGGSRILNEAIIKKYKNQDCSFVNKKFGFTVPKRTSAESTYIKLCTITLTSNDANAVTRFLLLNPRNTNKGSEHIEVNVKAAIYGNISTGTKHCWVDVVDSHRLYMENIIAVETLKDETGYTIEVYFKSNYSDRSYMVFPIIESVNLPTATIEYTENQTSQASLPDGTNITTNGGCFALESMRVYWDGSIFRVMKIHTSTFIDTITNADDSVLLYDNPVYAANAITFPETSIIMKESTKIIALNPYYKTSSVVPYIPIISTVGTRAIRFIDIATGDLVVSETPTESINFQMTIAYEKR